MANFCKKYSQEVKDKEIKETLSSIHKDEVKHCRLAVELMNLK